MHCKLAMHALKTIALFSGLPAYSFILLTYSIAIKNWMMGRPGNEAIHCSNYPCREYLDLSFPLTTYVAYLILLHLICYILTQCVSLSLAYTCSQSILYRQDYATQVYQSLPSILVHFFCCQVPTQFSVSNASDGK